MKIVSLIFLALYLCGFPQSAQAQISINNELLDYLIQDVCVDANNVAYAQDPLSCAANRRNITVGEPSPYIMTDFDRKIGATYGHHFISGFIGRWQDGGSHLQKSSGELRIRF